MKREKFEIIFINDRWVLREQITHRIIETNNTKQDLEERLPLYGKVWKSKKILAEVQIKNKDGKIEDTRTYGDDPFPPKG